LAQTAAFIYILCSYKSLCLGTSNSCCNSL